jgi:hypothetical protein
MGRPSAGMRRPRRGKCSTELSPTSKKWFSRVGLDREVTQAMLYVGQQFDWNVGSGGFWLFSKPDGEWTEAGSVGSWLS